MSIPPPVQHYRTAIVGGGIVGLFTAYRLLAAGAGPVVVLDRGYLASGASGRNGGGVRQQWETVGTIRLAREAVRAWREFPREFGYNIWFRQGGYLFLAMDAEEMGRLETVRSAVLSEGLPARRLRVEEIPARVPGISMDGIAGATYLGSDGTLYPFPAVWGVYEAVRRLGGVLRYGEEVTGILRSGRRAVGVVTHSGPVHADWVVNAAGGWSGEVSRRAGLASPNVASRHEILATEPLKPFLTPMVVRLQDGLYFSQTMRGEIVGGLTLRQPGGTEAGAPSSPEFLRRMAAALTGLIPRLGSLGVLRAWSGYYDDTPDGLPILGEDPGLDGFVQANGFGGHGFMLAPATSRRIAAVILGERSDLDPALFGPGRFLRADRTVRPEGAQLG
ncbi:MAG: NAD(P)/FAD-dependent oxidoreductase [Thermoplasmata archaeon]